MLLVSISLLESNISIFDVFNSKYTRENCNSFWSNKFLYQEQGFSLTQNSLESLRFSVTGSFFTIQITDTEQRDSYRSELYMYEYICPILFSKILYLYNLTF